MRQNIPERFNLQGYYKDLRKNENNGLSNLSISAIQGPIKNKGDHEFKMPIDINSQKYGDPARSSFGNRDNVNLHTKSDFGNQDNVNLQKNNFFKQKNRDEVDVQARKPDNFPQFRDSQNDPRRKLTNNLESQMNFPDGNLAPLQPDYDNDSNYNQSRKNTESYNNLKETVQSNFGDFVRDSQTHKQNYNESLKELSNKNSNIRSSSRYKSPNQLAKTQGNFFGNNGKYPDKPITLNSYRHDNRPVYNPPLDSPVRLNSRTIAHEDDIKMINGWPHKKTEIEKFETDPRTGSNVKKTYLTWVPQSNNVEFTKNNDMVFADQNAQLVEENHQGQYHPINHKNQVPISSFNPHNNTHNKSKQENTVWYSAKGDSRGNSRSNSREAKQRSPQQNFAYQKNNRNSQTNQNSKYGRPNDEGSYHVYQQALNNYPQKSQAKMYHNDNMSYQKASNRPRLESSQIQTPSSHRIASFKNLKTHTSQSEQEFEFIRENIKDHTKNRSKQQNHNNNHVAKTDRQYSNQNLNNNHVANADRQYSNQNLNKGNMHSMRNTNEMNNNQRDIVVLVPYPPK